MAVTVESVCRIVRELARRPDERIKLKFSALNDAVSKALTGVPYARAVAAERAGKPHAIDVCPAAIATVAAIYGVDRGALQHAIAIAALRAKDASASGGIDFWPFPERERALAQLAELMERPLDGRHVVLASHQATAGTTTIVRELMRRRARAAIAIERPFDRQTHVVGPYLRLCYHYQLSLYALAYDALAHILAPPMDEPWDLPRGKAVISAACEAVQAAGVDRLLFDEFVPPLSRLGRDSRAALYLRGLEAYLLNSPVKAMLGCSRWHKALASAMPRLWQKSDVVTLEPIGDSAALRAWLVAADPVQCVGEYDDAMVEGLLAVSDGNVLLIERYANDAVGAVLLGGQVKELVRKRVRSLVDVADSRLAADCLAVSDLIYGRDRHH